METTKAQSSDGCAQARLTVPQVSVGQRLDRICDATQTAWKGGCVAITEVRNAMDIDGRVARHPYAMMAAATGSGYLLGGGGFSPLTARLVSISLRLGIRIVAIPLIRRELLGLIDVSRDTGTRTDEASHQSRPTNTTSDVKEST